jgi:signal transduction histidine kinase
VAWEVLALASNEMQREHVILRVELADGRCVVRGDQIQLQQVILNLLRNAVDAMKNVPDRPKELEIRTEREDTHRVRLAVKDSGIGLSSQEIQRVFEPFYTTKKTGMGIGLSVSRSIVESHGGRLWATPNEGPGAMFSFSLPLS